MKSVSAAVPASGEAVTKLGETAVGAMTGAAGTIVCGFADGMAATPVVGVFEGACLCAAAVDGVGSGSEALAWLEM